MLQITKVEISNYKCIGNIKAELHPFTVLIGPNDSGKTSFMEAVHLVSRLANQAGKANPLHDLSLWPLGRKTIQKGKAKNEKIGISIEGILDGKVRRQLSAAQKSSVINPPLFKQNKFSGATVRLFL